VPWLRNHKHIALRAVDHFRHPGKLSLRMEGGMGGVLEGIQSAGVPGPPGASTVGENCNMNIDLLSDAYNHLTLGNIEPKEIRMGKAAFEDLMQTMRESRALFYATDSNEKPVFRAARVLCDPSLGPRQALVKAYWPAHAQGHPPNNWEDRLLEL